MKKIDRIVSAIVDSQATALGEWNTSLEGRAAEQVGELDRLSRLRRFLQEVRRVSSP